MLASRMDRATLLVAEPNALQRQLIDMMLTVDDMSIVAVATGQEALAYLREHTPSAMLFAVDLADVDGFTLCQKAKAVGRLTQVPVVLVTDAAPTGGVDETTRGRARACGADLLLQRPLGDKNLRERIVRLIQAPATDPGLLATASLPLPPAAPTPNPFGISMAAGTPQPASELGSLRAEVAQLRTENAALQARLTKYKALVQSLEQQLEDERKKPKGLFGRRG
jgi:CheY-like chemotaxis protein